QLSNESSTNLQIISNFRNQNKGDTLELGCFVDPLSFIGLGPIRTAERFSTAERRFGGRAMLLGDIVREVTLGSADEDFEFPPRDNALYIPLIGNSDVVASADQLRLKSQNYVQVVVDPAISEARFVAQFLNSELGKESRESAKTGFISKLNKQT